MKENENKSINVRGELILKLFIMYYSRNFIYQFHSFNEVDI